MLSPWWRDAVFYEVYVRSFQDSDGDGVGDLAGIRRRLPYLADLGVDALWLTPFYPSPQADHGYDVADYLDVDPRFGTLADFDALLSAAHDLRIRVVVDVVPNHTSDRHPWFQAALAAGPGSPARARYIFRDGRGAHGQLPPNNWPSVFGGRAWTRVPDGQWYLHLFAPEQPDLDWRHPDVAPEFERILRFWLDRGVDGFRIDVAHGLFKDVALPDLPPGDAPDLMALDIPRTPMWNQPEVHGVYRQWRALVDSYGGDRVLVGEVWLGDAREQARYLGADRLHLAFNFRLLHEPWRAAGLRRAIDRSVHALGDAGVPSTWVLSNHDVVRHLTRYGEGSLGVRRARAAVLLLLALPGAVFLYQGEELGLPEVDLPAHVRQDPEFFRTNGAKLGRDGSRVPMPWAGDRPPYGFSEPRADTWLPMPEDWAARTAQAQAGDPHSVLELYRRALALRHEQRALGDGPMHWLPAPDDALVFQRPQVDGGHGLVCAVNLGSAPLPLPDGDVLLASEDLRRRAELPPDAAAWVRVASRPAPSTSR